MSAVSWVVLIACTICWPIVGIGVYLVWRSAKRHDEMEARERAERTAAGDS